MKNTIIPICLAMLLGASCSANRTQKNTMEQASSAIREETVTYQLGDLTMKGFIAYNPSKKGKSPVVFVIHEWWGQNDYARMRTRKLAELGYVAMAVDLYGNGQTADNPTDAGALATPFYKNPPLAKDRFEAAIRVMESRPEADPGRMAAIGYCFGGAQVINMAKMGEPLKAVVSFHGNLNVVPVEKEKLKAEILVCHGAADPLVPETEVAEFKKQMDAAGSPYIFKAYPGATHAFTNPNATAVGEKYKIPVAYQEAADLASWEEMKNFLARTLR